MEIGTQVNVIPRNKNLRCYNTVDKAISIMSKNIGPGIINCLFVLDSSIPKHQKKVQTSHEVKNRVESASWKTL